MDSIIIVYFDDLLGSMKLITCLPDQLLLAHTVKSKTRGKSMSVSDFSKGLPSNFVLNARLSFTTRPCSPLESLVLGLVSVTEGIYQHQQIKQITSHGQTDTMHTPYFDPYTVISSPVRPRPGDIDLMSASAASVSDTGSSSMSTDMCTADRIERNLSALRSLVTTYCPPRPLAGDFTYFYF